MDYSIYRASNSAISRSFPSDKRDVDSSLIEEVRSLSFGEFPFTRVRLYLTHGWRSGRCVAVAVPSRKPAMD